MPKYPSHPNCDCKKLKLDFAKVKKNINAQCDIKKFTDIYSQKSIKKMENLRYFTMIWVTQLRTHIFYSKNIVDKLQNCI